MNDLIGRQRAIDTIGKMQTYKLFEGDDMVLVDKDEAQKELMMLPSAERKGKWITYYHGGTDLSYSCNQCGAQAPFIWMSDKQKKSNYCYNCGAQMEGGEADE